MPLTPSPARRAESDEEAPKAEEKKEEESKKGIVLDEKTMKVVTLLVLLVSDFDFLLTIVSVTSYFFAAGIFYLFLGLIGAFFMIYIGGCVIAARESGKFIDRFKEKVDGNEIQGISTEDLNAALEGARIFWKGTIYEDWKKREACLKQLRLANDNLDTQKMTKDDCDILDAQLKEAEISGLALLVKKDTKNKNRFDDAYGQRMIDQYAAKLKEGRDALAAREGGAAGEAHVPLKPPPGNASGAAGGDAADEEEVDPAIKAFHKEIDDARDPPKDKKGKTIGAPDDLLALNLEKVRAPPPPPVPPFPQPSPPPATLVPLSPRPPAPFRPLPLAGDARRARHVPRALQAPQRRGQDRRPGRRRPRAVHGVRGEGAPRLVPHGLAPVLAPDRQARPLGALLPADGVRVAAVGLALRLRRHPQRQRPLLVHGGHPAAHVRDRLPRLAGHARRVPLRRQGPEPAARRGLPGRPPLPGHPLEERHRVRVHPALRVPRTVRDVLPEPGAPRLGYLRGGRLRCQRRICDPTTFDVDELKADGSRRFEVGTTCGVGSCNEVQVGPDLCSPTRYLGTGKCTPIEDFMKQTVQTVLICCSFAIGIFSTVLSILNIILDFPAQLFDIAEKEEEALQFTLKAEEATKTWEDKLHAEVQENIRQRLKLTKSMPRSEEDYKEREKKGELKKFDQINPIAPNEAPSLIITGVIELEKDVMQKKVGYIEHFMMMSEEEKQRRDNLRKGITPGEEKEEEVKEEKPKKEKSKAAAPKEVQIKGDTKLVIKEKTNKDRNLERARSGAAVSADAPAPAAAAAAPEAAPEDAPAQDTDAA